MQDTKPEASELNHNNDNNNSNNDNTKFDAPSLVVK